MPLPGSYTSTNLKKSAGSGRQSLAANAYQTLYRHIISLAYEPGQRLEENQLVEQLGIGRTPVREALLRLAADLLVESSPGKGYTVRPITIQNTKAAFDALLIMELGVAHLAVRQDTARFLTMMEAANDDVAGAMKNMDILELVEANGVFHSHYAACSRNLYLMQALQKVRCETNRLAYLSYGNEIELQRSLKEHYTSVVEQHQQIIELIRDRDESGLKAVIQAHIRIFKNRMIQYLIDS
ncbi:AsnC family transcriptional regulator [Desulfosarcina alkanivorans]|uniref:AsnC family transcriptional regulator n=1 Tax=Desulfosarcina alkanivorans TaxID=571177 RepID=A0A5K7YJP7_9BACT|nr:GntR family transcriptional regulator [Desulfosarcina alkanivorans]BBO69902.1 AsnC family transcriptional regulator [Desulfosarcina alkanivorans]